MIGPILGAVGINALKSWATRAYPDYWLIMLGTLFIVVVVLMPGGLVGLPAQLRPWLSRRFRKPKDEPGSPSAVNPTPGEVRVS